MYPGDGVDGGGVGQKIILMRLKIMVKLQTLKILFKQGWYLILMKIKLPLLLVLKNTFTVLVHLHKIKNLLQHQCKYHDHSIASLEMYTKYSDYIK